MKSRRYNTICIVGTLIALSLGVANKIRSGAPPDAQPHLALVRDAAQRALGDVPGMIVQPGHLPRQAFEMLRPNVLEARSYTDLATGQTFSVLLVHCADISDMGAHYPPACYPGSGLKVTSTTPTSIELGDDALSGVEYELQPSRIDDRIPICIWNCMFLPGGLTTFEPAMLRGYVRSTNLRYFGAGQIQVLVPASLPMSQRMSIYRRAVSIYAPALMAMLRDPRTLSEPPDAGVAHE